MIRIHVLSDDIVAYEKFTELAFDSTVVVHIGDFGIHEVGDWVPRLLDICGIEYKIVEEVIQCNRL